jgi:hypothetical protein
VWAAQTVYLPVTTPTHTAAQWWQIGTDGTVLQLGRMEDATATTFYAYPSIAVNKQSDALLGFSSLSSAQYATASFAFRASTDPSGTMRAPGALTCSVFQNVRRLQ